MFVLLDDARPGSSAGARWYRNPVEIVVTRKRSEVSLALEALRLATRNGLHAAGYLAYDALRPAAGRGVGDEDLDAEAERAPAPLLWFGLFRTFEQMDASEVPNHLGNPETAWIGTPRPMVDFQNYRRGFDAVIEHIRAGDIYQANLSFQAQVNLCGDPLALYAGLRIRAHAGYGAVIRTGAEWVLSLSPELFFACADDQLIARPMKGTSPRTSKPDNEAASALADDPKQRAENLMIVDLMRNDLTQVAQPGTIEVPSLFDVETYPTVHQMTSTVTGVLDADKDMIDAITALFPCGSVTGAPKSAAMRVIGEVESASRGLYTGAIGRIDAGARSGAFNVAIRTLRQNGPDTAVMGLGSGVVADSSARGEWEECLAKGAFVASTEAFDLVETMTFDPREGIPRLEAHLTRMKGSADHFGFQFDRHQARNELQAATFRLRSPARIRLMLGPNGRFSIQTGAAPSPPRAPVVISLTPRFTSASDFRLRHKTSDRRPYGPKGLLNLTPMAGPAERATESTVFDYLFVDSEGFLTEGTFTSLFVREEGSGMLLTPPLTRGLLPGILRAELLSSGKAREADLTPEDLKQVFFVGNAVRGLVPARLSGL